MLPYDIILKKRNGEELSKEEIKFFIEGYVKGNIPDYQASAFLMAVYFAGMTDEETADLVEIMVYSGDTIDLSAIPGIKVDKHSTGGVGDTTTLILAPLVAACGVPVAKMSGRGLGHTGGTLDKLESIPGFNIHLTQEEFIEQVNKIGVSVIGQTEDLAPADKKLYALRDVTATIDSIPLIAGSIMSKKIAAGSDAILLDVKVGSGAFMTKLDDARKLAKLMVNIGTLRKRRTVAMLTNMDEPLGAYIGNALEVREAIEILQGKHAGSPLYEVSLKLGAYMLYLGKAAASAKEGFQKIEQALLSGKGLQKMKEMIASQKGDPSVADDVSKLPSAKHQTEVLSPVSGYVQSFKTAKVGQCALILGAGRARKSDVIDPAVGLILKKRTGDWVEEGEPVAVIYANDKEKAERAEKMYLESINLSAVKAQPAPLIFDTITHEECAM